MTLAELVVDVPVVVRVVVGLLGALLLVAGARWLRAGLAVAAFGIGASAVGSVIVALGPYLPSLTAPMIAIPAALIGGVALLVMARMVERLAMFVVGAFSGLIVGVAVLSVFGGPVWLALFAALVGALVFPWVWERLLRVVTSLVGAGLVAWAVGQPEQPWLIGGLALVGTVVQFSSGRAADDDEEDG